MIMTFPGDGFAAWSNQARQLAAIAVVINLLATTDYRVNRYGIDQCNYS